MEELGLSLSKYNALECSFHSIPFLILAQKLEGNYNTKRREKRKPVITVGRFKYDVRNLDFFYGDPYNQTSRKGTIASECVVETGMKVKRDFCRKHLQIAPTY